MVLEDKGARKHKVAIIGSGPGGFYAALELLKHPAIEIDLFDKLPTPFGLVRYGIAPDNQRMKTVSRIFSELFEGYDRLTFIGNVEFGKDFDRFDLLERYDSIIYATGAGQAKTLGIPGENLPDVFSSRDFVNWYNGNPLRLGPDFSLNHPVVAVIGGGNVALDTARMLLNSFNTIKNTDVPDSVMQSFNKNMTSTVYLFVRQGPARSKFTPTELRALLDIEDTDIILDEEDLVLCDKDVDYLSKNQQSRVNLDIFKTMLKLPPKKNNKKLFIKFWCTPACIEKTNMAYSLLLNKSQPAGGTGEANTNSFHVSINALFYAIGSVVDQIAGIPFADDKKVIPNNSGQIIGPAGNLMREFVCGWAKRGATGTVGTNRKDSKETVDTLLSGLVNDRHDGCEARPHALEIRDMFRERGVNFTDWNDWLYVDGLERNAGQVQGRPRVKFADLTEIMDRIRCNSK